LILKRGGGVLSQRGTRVVQGGIRMRMVVVAVRAVAAIGIWVVDTLVALAFWGRHVGTLGCISDGRKGVYPA
jgi:hypothetical protein